MSIIFEQFLYVDFRVWAFAFIHRPCVVFGREWIIERDAKAKHHLVELVHHYVVLCIDVGQLFFSVSLSSFEIG